MIGTYVSGENAFAFETGPDGSLDVRVIEGYAGPKPRPGEVVRVAGSDLGALLDEMRQTAGGQS